MQALGPFILRADIRSKGTTVALVVQKYGGSSVSDADRIRRVAERIVETKKAGNDVVVVVSAMGTPPTNCWTSPNRSAPRRPLVSWTCC